MTNRQMRPTVQLPPQSGNFNSGTFNSQGTRNSYNNTGGGSPQRALPPRLHQYQLNRRKFASKAYLIAILAMLFSTAQWIPFYLISSTREFFSTHFYVSMMFLFAALILVTVFVFFEVVRFTMPVNYIFTVLIVEFLTLGMIGAFVAHSNLLLFGLAIAIACLLTLAFVLIGIIVPHDFTLDVVVLFLMSVIFFIGSVFFVMLYVLMSMPYTEFIYALFVITSVALFTMYHAQTINGGRYAEMRLPDFLLAGLIIFHDFALFLISTFLIILSIWCRYLDEPK